MVEWLWTCLDRQEVPGGAGSSWSVSFPTIAPSPRKELDSGEELRNLWKKKVENHDERHDEC